MVSVDRDNKEKMMWKLLCSLFEEPKKSSVDVLMDKIKGSALSVEAMQVVEQRPVKLREPVQVLLDSLEEGWWDFKVETQYWIGNGRHEHLVARHEWLQTKLALDYRIIGTKNTKLGQYPYEFDHETPVYDYTLSEPWMTKDENKLVKDAILKADNLLRERRERRATEVREGQFLKLLELKEK